MKPTKTPELVLSYNKKTRQSLQHTITVEERNALRDYHRMLRNKDSDERRERRKISGAKYYLKTKLSKQTRTAAESAVDKCICTNYFE